MITTAPKPLEQKYADPYYQIGAGGEHYVMSDGVRSRHESSGEAYHIINMIKANKKEAAQ